MTWKPMAALALSAGLTAAPPAQAAEEDPPRMVQAFASQLVGYCGAAGPAAAAAAQTLIQRADLNADGQAEWIVDATRYPCPKRPQVAVEAGALVTVFARLPSGDAAPVFQQPAFNAVISRPQSGPPVLTLTIGGAACGGADTAARCDRRVRWDTAGKRYGLAAR